MSCLETLDGLLLWRPLQIFENLLSAKDLGIWNDLSSVFANNTIRIRSKWKERPALHFLSYYIRKVRTTIKLTLQSPSVELKVHYLNQAPVWGFQIEYQYIEYLSLFCIDHVTKTTALFIKSAKKTTTTELNEHCVIMVLNALKSDITWR